MDFDILVGPYTPLRSSSRLTVTAGWALETSLDVMMVCDVCKAFDVIIMEGLSS